MSLESWALSSIKQLNFENFLYEYQVFLNCLLEAYSPPSSFAAGTACDISSWDLPVLKIVIPLIQVLIPRLEFNKLVKPLTSLHQTR